MRRDFLHTFMLLLFPLTALAQPPQNAETEPEPWLPPGAMTVEALQAEPVRSERDVPYAATDNPRQTLDLYLPAEPASDKLPVIAFIHGGGWRKGDKATGARPLLRFARGGKYAGVSIAYRLSGEATWPAQMHDVKAAIRWIRAHADDYGLDPDRIAVWGRSAGGHLALMLGVTGDLPEFEGDLGPHVGESTAVSGVANWFGVTDMMAMVGQATAFDRAGPDAPEALLLGGVLPENADAARAASPVTHVSPGDPPVLTIHGTEDWTVPYDQAVRLHTALAEAGVISYFITVNGAGHGNFPREATDRTVDFFAKVLRDEDIAIDTAPLSKPREAERPLAEPSPAPRPRNPFLPQTPPR